MTKLRPPRWYQERWVIFLSLFLAPPLGIALAVFSPEISRGKKVLGAVLLMGVAGVLGALEVDSGPFRTVYLDGLQAYHYTSGNRLLDERRYAEALPHLVRASELEPLEPGNFFDDPPPLRAAVSAALCARMLGRKAEARARLAGAARDRDSIGSHRARLALCGELLVLERKEPACSWLNELLDERKVFPLEGYVLLNRGRCELLSEDPRAARAPLVELIWSHSRRYLARAYDLLADLEAGEESKEGHDRVYELRLMALRFDPASRKMWTKAREAAGQGGHSLPALRAFRTACYYQIELESHSTAAPLFERLARKETAFALPELCLLLLAEERFVEGASPLGAAALLEKALASVRSAFLRAEILYRLGRMRETAGLLEEARKPFHSLQSEFPHSARFARLARRQLRRLDQGEDVRNRLERIEKWTRKFSDRESIEW